MKVMKVDAVAKFPAEVADLKAGLKACLTIYKELKNDQKKAVREKVDLKIVKQLANKTIVKNYDYKSAKNFINGIMKQYIAANKMGEKLKKASKGRMDKVANAQLVFRDASKRKVLKNFYTSVAPTSEAKLGSHKDIIKTLVNALSALSAVSNDELLETRIAQYFGPKWYGLKNAKIATIMPDKEYDIDKFLKFIEKQRNKNFKVDDQVTYQNTTFLINNLAVIGDAKFNKAVKKAYKAAVKGWFKHKKAVVTAITKFSKEMKLEKGEKVRELKNRGLTRKLNAHEVGFIVYSPQFKIEFVTSVDGTKAIDKHKLSLTVMVKEGKSFEEINVGIPAISLKNNGMKSLNRIKKKLDSEVEPTPKKGKTIEAFNLEFTVKEIEKARKMLGANQPIYITSTDSKRVYLYPKAPSETGYKKATKKNNVFNVAKLWYKIG